MIKYKNKTFKNYIDLLYYMIAEGNINEKYFTHSKFFYIKYLLEEKFSKKFTIRKVKQILAEELALNNIKMI